MSPEQVESAHNEIASAYLSAMLQLLHISGQKEVNFMKKTVTLPNGGIYLLQFQHVSGPKINLDDITKQNIPEKV